MNLTNYAQFLRLYSSKYINKSLIKVPHVQSQFLSRKVQYILDSSISEEDISTLIHFIILSKSINIGFSAKFIYIYTSFKDLADSGLSRVGTSSSYIAEKSGVWGIATQSPDLQLEKKYSVKSPLIQPVRKLFRRAGVDFYVDQASFIINYRLEGSQRPSCTKENEMLIRFFGFPLRITS